MAVMYIRGAGMSAEEREREDSTVSSLKEETEYAFPDGEVFAGVPSEMSKDDRSTLAVKISRWEKDGLIKRKAAGGIEGQSLKDTRGRYGAPREWDHLQFSLDRAESESVTSVQLEQMRRAIIDVAGHDISGSHRKMVISRIHTDTGNTHLDIFIHRHAYDATKNGALPADEITGTSRLASVIEQINKRLRGLDLPTMADVKKQDGRSLYEETATSDKAKNALNDLVSDAGGLPMQRTGAPSNMDAPIPLPRISDPDISAIERLVRDAEREAKSAAQRLVDAQNALEAQRQKVELRQRVENLENDVSARDATIAQRDATLEAERAAAAQVAAAAVQGRAEQAAVLMRTEQQLEEMGGRYTQAAHERDEQRERANGFEKDYASAQEELTEQVAMTKKVEGDLSSMTQSRDSALGERDAERVRAEQAEAALQIEHHAREQAEVTAKAEAKRAEQAEVQRDVERTRAEQAEAIANAERQAKAEAESLAKVETQRASQAETQRDTERARAALAEVTAKAEAQRATQAEATLGTERGLFEQIKSSLQSTIDVLREQIVALKSALVAMTRERDTELVASKTVSNVNVKAMAAIKDMTAKAAEDVKTIAELRKQLDGDDNEGGGTAKPKLPTPGSK